MNCGWMQRQRFPQTTACSCAGNIHGNKHTQESQRWKTRRHLRSTEYVKHCPAERPQPGSTTGTAWVWVAFLTGSLASECFPDYFWVSGNVAGASALWVTPHRSQRMSAAANTPLSAHLKRQCSYLEQVRPTVRCNIILRWSDARQTACPRHGNHGKEGWTWRFKDNGC